MGNTVIINQQNIMNLIVGIDSKLKNKASYRNEMTAKYLPGVKYNTDKNYVIISSILQKEMKIKGYGKVTVWRVLKIYKADKNAFERLRSGESVKTVYRSLFPSSSDEKKKVVAEPETITINTTEIDSWDSCYQVAVKINEFLSNVEPVEDNEVPMEKVRKQLFFCSKTIQRKQSDIAKNRKWEQDW